MQLIADWEGKGGAYPGNTETLFCSDGVGRTGAFITMHAQMERMKAEAVINIFQFIKAIRIQRAGLVSNKV